MAPEDIQDVIARLRRFEDARTGVAEEFLPEPVGANGLAVLTTPNGTEARTGVVFCRSPAPEQGPLQRLEAIAARELATRGVASIRIRRGFGREGEPSDLSLAESLAEAEGAVAALQATCDLDRVGVAGALLGAAVALGAAARLDLAFAGLICPVSGPAFLRDLFRRQLVAGFMTPSDRVARREPFEERLVRGPTLVRGLRLTKSGFDELSSLDLGAAAREFAGDVLVLGVSRSGEPDEAARELAETLDAAGRPAAVTVVADPLPNPFGELYVRMVTPVKQIEVRLELDRELSRLLADWVESR